MRKALDRLGELYKTQLGQDVIETLLGAGVAAGGQAMFTDMTPEEILLSTGVGVGAAAVGRPIVGRAGQAIGRTIATKNPKMEAKTQRLLQDMVNSQPSGAMREALLAKLAPYSGLPATSQLGQVIGRGYGDNIAQGLVALAAPGLLPGEDDAA